MGVFNAAFMFEFCQQDSWCFSRHVIALGNNEDKMRIRQVPHQSPGRMGPEVTSLAGLVGFLCLIVVCSGMMFLSF